MTLPEGVAPASIECPHCRHTFSPNLPLAGRAESELSVAGAISPKSRLLAGLLGVFAGGLGLHRFYLGYVGIGFLQIAVTALSWLMCLRIHGYTVGFIWGFIEGVLILAGRMRDAQGRRVVEF